MPPKTDDKADRKPRKRAKEKPAPVLPSAVDDALVVDLVPQQHGGALRTGNPGNKGGGRKPDYFKQLARDAIEEHGLIEVAARIAAGLEGEIRTMKIRGPEGDTLVRVYTDTPLKERNAALATLIKLGIGFQNQLVGEDGGPLTVYVAVGPKSPAQIDAEVPRTDPALLLPPGQQ